MMKKWIEGFGILGLGIVVISLIGCTTCGTPYRRELSQNSDLKEANESYKKAIGWLDKGECASTPSEAEKSYTTAESYVSDAVSKLKEAGNNKNIDVSEDVYYCEKIKRETDVKIGQADRSK
jgi:hypothetical protein